MTLVRSVVFAVTSLVAMAAQASATFTLPMQGEASVWTAWGGSDTEFWGGNLLVETPDGADGTYFDPRVAFDSDLAWLDFDTASEPFPDEEVWATLQGGKLVSVSGAWVDGGEGWWRHTSFGGSSMTQDYFATLVYVQATGAAVVPVDEPAGVVLLLAGLAAMGAGCRRRPADFRPALA